MKKIIDLGKPIPFLFPKATKVIVNIYNEDNVLSFYLSVMDGNDTIFWGKSFHFLDVFYPKNNKVKKIVDLWVKYDKIRVNDKILEEIKNL